MLTVVTPASNTALTTVDHLREELDLPAGAEVSRLPSLIARASDMIVRHCGQSFARQTYRETWRGEAGPVLILSRGPALVAAVTVEGEPAEEGSWEFDAELWHLRRLAGRAVTGWAGQTVSALYAAGYTLPGEAGLQGVPRLPGDVEQACLTLATALRANGPRNPMLRSESTEGTGSASYIAAADMRALPPQVVDLLRDYRSGGLS